MSNTRNGRAARIRAYLVEHGKATMDELHAACGDGTRRLTASSVSTLVTQGKVRRGIAKGTSVYYPTPAIHIDGRVQRRVTRLAHEQKAKVKKAATRATPAPTNGSGKTSPWAFGGQTRPGAAVERETVDQFLARGGRIERLPHGASATPVAGGHAAQNAATWHHRQERLAAAAN